MALLSGATIGSGIVIDRATGGAVGGAIGDVTGAIGGAARDLFGSGVNRDAGRKAEMPLFRLVQKVQRREVQVTGDVRLQLEYYGSASNKGDASERARIFAQFQGLSSAKNADGSGRIHNEITIGPRDLPNAQRIAQDESELKVYVKEAPIRDVQQRTTGGQQGGQRGGQQGGQRGGQRATGGGFLQNVGTLPLLLVAGIVGYLISQP